jgi:hypothetical protein
MTMANGTHITLLHLGRIPRALRQLLLFRRPAPNLTLQSLFLRIFRRLVVMPVDPLAHWDSVDTWE